MSQDSDDISGQSSISRRKLVKAVGTASVLGGVGASSSFVSAEDSATPSVIEVTGEKADEKISHARTQQDVQLIHEELVSHGWHIDLPEAQVTHTVTPDADYYTVLLPYTVPAESEYAFIVWTGTTKFQNQGVHVEPKPAQSPPIDLITHYRAVGGSINTTTERVNVEEFKQSVSGSSVGTQVAVDDPPTGGGTGGSGGSGGGGADIDCDVQWDCVIAMAARYAGNFGACADCGWGTKTLCLKCLSWLIGRGYGFTCDYCG